MIDALYCVSLLREIKDLSFATVNEEGRPTVRTIDAMFTEGERLYFLAARGKDFYADLLRTHYVAIVGLTNDFRSIRISGTVERPDDQRALVDRAFEENPSMKDLYTGDSRYILEIFTITSGFGEYFDLSSSPIYRESFTLGDGVIPDKGFNITEDCTECGLCADACPQKCILPDTPYYIKQENCLHCGICYETCRSQAIVNKGK